MSESQHTRFMREAIELSRANIRKGSGGPFGAVIVQEGVVIARGTNLVTSANDPTAHAEIVAIREACRNLGSFRLDGCVIYSSCEPCPMCLGAIYWARPAAVYYAATRDDASSAGFDDRFLYDELPRTLDKRKIPMVQLLREESLVVLREWEGLEDKTPY